MSKLDPTGLTGKLLIAMPGMADPRFDQAVIFLCAHSDEGAMGLMVNKPTSEVTLRMLLEQLSIDPVADIDGLQVHYGGPVEMGRGFVLHSPDYESVVATLEVDDRFHMTATLDVLESIAIGAGPETRLMLLGYAGWGPGQLEGELAANGWLICDASPELVFRVEDDDKWEAALNSLGVSPLNLSSEGGRA
ncbi:hypothetical protein P775_25585 [Puniceibacterium antarcticum]|uniref:UPF0301 protein P775_25585 n=1 Tax=Puniceibacterium antarcticum TaxID=1206336 RepID=A0A2G8R210_9RHOB|nr:YqgE/AlgH family protein [Puniceibacterium antarcticum]PIL15553.1 hypothetical protein P775_25585 [Puniceibacterium antarcticum]